MSHSLSAVKTSTRLALSASLCLAFLSFTATAQTSKVLYSQIKAFSLTGGKADVNGLVLTRDRVEMTFTGSFYFSAPINGKVTGAVFIGQGTFKAQVPPSDFERGNVKRLLGVEDVVASDFRSAVLKFSDDTMDTIGKNRADSIAPAQAQTLASEIDSRILRETGANISSRIAISIINQEQPGFFYANFDGGKRGRFSYIYDYQKRIPTAAFNINGGERGLVFSYKNENLSNDIWLAFYSLDDYKRGDVTYSDYNDLVDISHYDMDIDLTDPKKRLGLKIHTKLSPRFGLISAIPFNLGEGLGEEEKERLKKQLRVRSVRSGGEELEFVQEDWEGGFTVFLSTNAEPSRQIDLDFELDGDFLQQPENVNQDDSSYPVSTGNWYPRHGYLDRSTFNFTFTHSKRLKVACVGVRESEWPSESNKETTVTKYVLKAPVALVTFALAPFTRHTEMIKWDNTEEQPIPLEFNSLDHLSINEEFTLTELNNSVRYFHMLFGRYPYQTFSATFHPYGFGQGFPSMLLLPATNTDNKYTFAFIAHETSHQWWGNVVAWRSYRDQWLSEGFAEYSGVLYTNLRKNPGAGKALIDEMRKSLVEPPRDKYSLGKGRLVDVGPLIMGHRLSTRKTRQGYQNLIYNKGALVLRMIHFLLTDPDVGDGQPFFDMMREFVEKYRNRSASTDDFRLIANKHFARSSIARSYGLNNLDWFFQQFVYQTELPTYHLDYKFENQPGGSVIMSGNVTQTGGGEKWFMPIPIEFTFAGKKTATGVVAANGPKAAFNLKLPARPEKVEFDPYRWVLSEKTSSN